MTVALHSWGNPLHTRLKRTVRSPLVTAPTWPPFATALYCTVVAGTHTPPIMDLVLGNDAVHDAEHVLYLVAGYLFFLPVLGTEPLRHRVSAIGAYLMLLIAMMADSATGVTYTFQAREAFTPYARGARAWGPNLVTDLHLGGDVMFIGSDLIMASSPSHSLPATWPLTGTVCVRTAGHRAAEAAPWTYPRTTSTCNPSVEALSPGWNERVCRRHPSRESPQTPDNRG